MDSQIWNGLQGTKVSLLSLRLGGVAGTIGDDRSEIAYPAYLVLGRQKPH